MSKTRIKYFLKEVCKDNVALKPINKTWKEAKALKKRWFELIEMYETWSNDIKDTEHLLKELNNDVVKKTFLENNFTIYEQKTLRRLLRKSKFVKY